MSSFASSRDEMPSWRTSRRSPLAELVLSAETMAGLSPIEPAMGGFDIRLTQLDSDRPIPEGALRAASVAVVEVDRHRPGSVARFEALLQEPAAPALVAAVHNMSVQDLRSLLRLGAADVISIPIDSGELQVMLDRLHSELSQSMPVTTKKGKIVSVVKSVGGVGGTALATQLSALAALRAGKNGGEVCLIDLELQFGSAGLYLGMMPKLNLQHLLEAGGRADGALVRATANRHRAGLQLIAAPTDMLPLEMVDADQLTGLVDLAASEFSQVWVDLPSNWTNWSLSVMARSDLILIVSELTVASLHQTRRQIELLNAQGFADIPIQVVMNRTEKKLFGSLSFKDAERTIGRPVDHQVVRDEETMGTALDQGVLLSDVRSKTRLSKDLARLLDRVEAVLEAR